MSTEATGCVFVNLRWTPSQSQHRASQYVIASITEADGTLRHIEERCPNEHAGSFPIRVRPGSRVVWWLKTVDKYGVSNSGESHSFVAGTTIPPLPATNLGVDLMNANDELSPPSGTIIPPQQPVEPTSPPEGSKPNEPGTTSPPEGLPENSPDGSKGQEAGGTPPASGNQARLGGFRPVAAKK